jgi:hypothetical protein
MAGVMTAPASAARGDTGGRVVPGRKVRTPKGAVVGNAHRPERV